MKNSGKRLDQKIYTCRGTWLRGYVFTASGTTPDSWLSESWHNLNHELWKYSGMIQLTSKGLWRNQPRFGSVISFVRFLNSFERVHVPWVIENRYGAEQRTVGMGIRMSEFSMSSLYSKKLESAAIMARFFFVIITLLPTKRIAR